MRRQQSPSPRLAASASRRDASSTAVSPGAISSGARRPGCVWGRGWPAAGTSSPRMGCRAACAHGTQSRWLRCSLPCTYKTNVDKSRGLGKRWRSPLECRHCWKRTAAGALPTRISRSLSTSPRMPTSPLVLPARATTVASTSEPRPRPSQRSRCPKAPRRIPSPQTARASERGPALSSRALALTGGMQKHRQCLGQAMRSLGCAALQRPAEHRPRMRPRLDKWGG